LAVHRLGGHGPAVLFAHATGFHGVIWAPVAAALAERLECWAVDFRGHGDSPMPSPPPVDWAGFGRDVLAVAHHLGRPLIGVGHSLGAAALLMAELAEPGTFASLVLYEPAVPAPDSLDPDVQRSFIERTRRRRSRFASRVEATENFSTKAPTRDLADGSLHAYVAHGFRDDDTGQVSIKCAPDFEAAIYESAPSSMLWSQVRPIKCPVTLVRGGHSEDLHHQTTLWTAAQLSAPLVVLPDVGHFGPLQAPERFADLIRVVLTTA